MAKISRWFPNCLVYVYKVSLRLFPGFSSNNMVARRAYIILQFLTFSSLRLVLGFIPLLSASFPGLFSDSQVISCVRVKVDREAGFVAEYFVSLIMRIISVINRLNFSLLKTLP